MEHIKSICPNCGNIQLEQKTWKKRIFECIKKIFLIFVIFTSMIGATGLYNQIKTNVYEDFELTYTGLGQFYAFVTNFQSNFRYGEETKELKQIAEDLTKDCEQEDEYCKAIRIYEELYDFDYKWENATDLNPMHIWEAREGDCDQVSILLKTLLDFVSVDSLLSCNKNHCWVIIHLKNPKKTIRADLTGEGWREL